MKNKDGFTLVEILVVIAIISIIGVVMVAIFTNTLRGSNKSQILAAVKQNGQAVLESMDKTVRGADYVICVTPSGTTLVVVKNGNYTRYRMFASTASDNGSIQQDFPVQPQQSIIAAFLTSICTDTDPAVLPQVLTDVNQQTGVSVQKVSGANFFTPNPGAGSKDSVTIKFRLGPAIGAPSVIAGQVDPVTFQTTVQLR